MIIVLFYLDSLYVFSYLINKAAHTLSLALVYLFFLFVLLCNKEYSHCIVIIKCTNTTAIGSDFCLGSSFLFTLSVPSFSKKQGVRFTRPQGLRGRPTPLPTPPKSLLECASQD